MNYPGNTVMLRAKFTDPSGEVIDPSTVLLKIKRPDNQVEEFTEGYLIKEEDGVWYLNYVAEQEGDYRVRWETDVPDVAWESYFNVKPSAF